MKDYIYTCFRRLISAANNTMRKVRLRFFVLIGVAVLLVVLFQHVLFSRVNDQDQAEENVFEHEELTCRHPDLELTNPLIRKHIKDVGTLQCGREQDWVYTRRGAAFINNEMVHLHGRIDCTLTYVERVDDFHTRLGKTTHLVSDLGPVRLESDFFVADCTARDKKVWKNLMAAIHRNETLVQKMKGLHPPENAMKLNVIMYGLDSMSRMHFMRKLPKTYKYLTEVLNASVMKGYNIVGDGTPQALIPILTGSTEEELPETRKRIKGATFVDVYPFAWKNFSRSGYVTAWAEEQPHVGTFTYRLKGFKDLPTDHCMRSFYLKMYQVMSSHPKLCLGNKPRHKIMLDWLTDFYETYPDVPKFGFTFNSELSHDDYNIIGYADPDIEGFLKGLKESGVLENTMLIVMSDHGHRFAPIRASQQGKQEERLPFFSFVLPEWMREKYPQHMKNLKTNENRLVTPFDIHATFMTLLQPQVPRVGNVTSRSISLFTEIPKERTCESASIEPHWCTCLSWFKISTTGNLAIDIGQAVIDFINQMTEPQRSQCQKLELSVVTRLEKMIPNKKFLTFRKNADYDGRFGEFSDDTKVTEIVYQVQIHAFPSDAIYEAIVKHNTLDNSLHIKEDELSRVNMYGDQEHCIHDQYPQLRKYCYCKTQLKKR